MLEQWLVWERDLFFALNGSDFEWLDRVMWIYTGKMVWLPLAVLILFLLFYKRDWREAILVLLMIALVVTLCDQFASHVCKPLFTRFRPTHHPDFADQVKTVFGYRGGKYGFISSHAANAFGFAMFMSLLFRDRLFSCLIFLWAVVVSYSRIYLGVHYPGDLIVGGLIGIAIGCCVAIATRRLLQRMQPCSPLPPHAPAHLTGVTTSVCGLTVLSITIYSVIVQNISKI